MPRSVLMYVGFAGSGSIDVQILRLRRKIEPDPANPTYIKTERGAGYLFDAEVQAMR